MVTRPLVLVIICFGFFILLHSLVPNVVAQQKSSKRSQFMLQDQRTRKRKNFILPWARDSKILGNDDIEDINVGTQSLPYDLDSAEISAFIADYANMFRNDALPDDSVETRNRKRDNIQRKRDNQALEDPPCNCKIVKDNLDFGENAYPRYVEIRNCSTEHQMQCRPPYICRENKYDLTIIKRRESEKQGTLVLPDDLKFQWVAEIHPINVGCVCVRNYIVKT